MSSVGLYLHIPFCRAKCAYCDFNSYAGMESLHARYVRALCTEMNRFGDGHGRLHADTIYVGGGTPTTLSSDRLCQLIQTCRDRFILSPDAEINIEANPGTVDLEGLYALRAAGFNRVSFGAQSFSDDELKLLRRIHSADETREAVHAARAAGLDNLSLDLIYGLPLQTIADWQFTLEHALQLAPQHLSLYSLTVEDGTLLQRQIDAGDLPPPDADLAADMYLLSADVLASSGYQQYELSNWARPGSGMGRGSETAVCHHNLKYWRVEPYIGFGAGAHSHFGGLRRSNVKVPQEYVQCTEQGRSVLSEETAIGPDESMAETMILGLRLVEGVTLDEFLQTHGVDLRRLYAAELVELAELGLIESDDQVVRLTPRGRLLANQVFVRFWPPRAS